MPHTKRKKAKRGRPPVLKLLNIKLSLKDRKFFKRKADKLTNGNVTALIIQSVKRIPKSKFHAVA